MMFKSIIITQANTIWK